MDSETDNSPFTYGSNNKERYSQTISLAREYFIKRIQKGDPFEELETLDEWEYQKKFRILDMEKPLYEALQRLNILVLYLNSNISWEKAIELSSITIHVFHTDMKPWFSYRFGSDPNIDSYFLKIYNEFKKGN